MERFSLRREGSLEDRVRYMENFIYRMMFELEAFQERVEIAIESAEEENYKRRQKDGLQ